ncbi:hypothetical protein BDV95DRAFT_579454 [Massariosphaeria phaeospora]|uniref:Uncharacterized protein n=1 Tax=Massariosphaeria phaeospora TaxID=100035 RepID=A0A7C8IB87_9PLEO|nr:hypothetical protein BDV95DRAFT_579454 [Massariosphaeria phaeospora]
MAMGIDVFRGMAGAEPEARVVGEVVVWLAYGGVGIADTATAVVLEIPVDKTTSSVSVTTSIVVVTFSVAVALPHSAVVSASTTPVGRSGFVRISVVVVVVVVPFPYGGAVAVAVAVIVVFQKCCEDDVGSAGRKFGSETTMSVVVRGQGGAVAFWGTGIGPMGIMEKPGIALLLLLDGAGDDDDDDDGVFDGSGKRATVNIGGWMFGFLAEGVGQKGRIETMKSGKMLGDVSVAGSAELLVGLVELSVGEEMMLAPAVGVTTIVSATEDTTSIGVGWITTVVVTVRVSSSSSSPSSPFSSSSSSSSPPPNNSPNKSHASKSLKKSTNPDTNVFGSASPSLCVAATATAREASTLCGCA